MLLIFAVFRLHNRALMNTAMRRRPSRLQLTLIFLEKNVRLFQILAFCIRSSGENSLRLDCNRHVERDLLLKSVQKFFLNVIL